MRRFDFPKGPFMDDPMTRIMTLKEQLKFFLDLRGIAAADLARKSGVSKQVLSTWLAGAKPKNIEQAKRVAECLGTSLDTLLFGKGQPKDEQKFTELDALLGDGWVGGVFELKIRRVSGKK